MSREVFLNAALPLLLGAGIGAYAVVAMWLDRRHEAGAVPLSWLLRRALARLCWAMAWPWNRLASWLSPTEQG